MAIKTTDQFPVKLEYYYLLDFRRFMYPVLMPVYFPNKNTAKRLLKANIPNSNERRMFSIYSGRKIRDMKLNYKVKSGNYFSRGGKYHYPPEKISARDRKAYRTRMRRRLRRMNILTTSKARHRYDKKVKKVIYKRNTQRVAKSPNSIARVFQLDRKPPYLFYIILKKWPTFKSGKLFKVRAIKVDVRTGNFKKVTIYTMRNDIFIPYLLTDLQKIPNGQIACGHYTKYRLGKQNEALQRNLEKLR